MTTKKKTPKGPTPTTPHRTATDLRQCLFAGKVRSAEASQFLARCGTAIAYKHGVGVVFYRIYVVGYSHSDSMSSTLSDLGKVAAPSLLRETHEVGTKKPDTHAASVALKTLCAAKHTHSTENVRFASQARRSVDADDEGGRLVESLRGLLNESEKHSKLTLKTRRVELAKFRFFPPFCMHKCNHKM